MRSFLPALLLAAASTTVEPDAQSEPEPVEPEPEPVRRGTARVRSDVAPARKQTAEDLARIENAFAKRNRRAARNLATLQ